jgi:cell wall assembly regulator SMI1
MSIRPALDALLEALQDAGMPLVASLAPGLSRAEIDAKAASLPGHLAAEVIEYFEWRNGLAADREADTELLPQGIPLSLDEAVAQYGLQRTVAGQIAQQAGLPAGDIWHERWFPLFHNGAGDYYLTRLADGNVAIAPVHTVTNQERQPVLVHPSLTALIDHAAAHWKSGTYSVSEDGVVAETPAAAPDTVDAQLALLRDPDERVRWSAVRALGELRDPRAIPGLIRALDDSAEDVATQAAASLGLLKARDAIPALIHALERSRPQTRNTSAWALGEMKAEAAREALTRALDDPLGMVRQNAAAALERLDKKGR